jgi:hypothetical protein
MLLLIGSFVRLPGGKILSHVAWQSTLETHTKSLTSLRGGILLVLGSRTRNLLDKLPAARDGTLDIRNATPKSSDAASGTGNAGSKIADAGLASVHDSGMRF